MPTATYGGPLPRGRVAPVDRTLRFRKGEPVEVTSDEAAVLGASEVWTVRKTKPAPAGDDKPKATAAEADTTKEP